MQKTVQLHDGTLTLRTQQRTRAGNPMGFVVRVDDSFVGEPRRYLVDVLRAQEAMDTAFARHIKATR